MSFIAIERGTVIYKGLGCPGQLSTEDFQFPFVILPEPLFFSKSTLSQENSIPCFLMTRLEPPVAPILGKPRFNTLQISFSSPLAIFLRPPSGVGKGTYCSRIAKALKVPHIAAGDLVRSEMQAQSEVGKMVAGYVNSGR